MCTEKAVFNITIDMDKLPFYSFEEQCINGSITIGEFSERLFIPIEYWKPRDYMKQWIEGLSRIINGNNYSCLITAMRNPAKSGFINIWPIYLEDKLVIFQNHILMNKDIRSRYNGKNIYEFVESREKQSEDGSPISEWKISINELIFFIRKARNLWGSNLDK